MEKYFISAEIDGQEIIYAMNATTEASRSSPGKLSRHKLENGLESSDNYVTENNKYSLSGVISDVFLPGRGLMPTASFIQGLDRIRNEKIPFAVHISNKLTPEFPCYFQNLSIMQNTENGSIGETDSFKVKMSVWVTRISQSGEIVIGRSSEFVDATQDRQQTSRSTQELDDDQLTPLQEAVAEFGESSRALEESISGRRVNANPNTNP